MGTYGSGVRSTPDPRPPKHTNDLPAAAGVKRINPGEFIEVSNVVKRRHIYIYINSRCGGAIAGAPGALPPPYILIIIFPISFSGISPFATWTIEKKNLETGVGQARRVCGICSIWKWEIWGGGTQV